jgi:uncharacterized protein YndB with AHSA1/START domain
MTTKSNTIVEPPGLKFTIERIINAPCGLVFKAWTDPKQMVQWWSPEEVECRSVTADLKIGGAYRIHMISKGVDHIAIGQYQEIVPNKRLRFSWQWVHYPMPDSTVTVEFEDLGKTTRLTLTHGGLPDRDDVPDHKWGWNSAVAKFARLMEENKIKAD